MLESASPSPPQGSIWHRNRVRSQEIDVESMANRPLRRGGRGGFEGEVRGSVPNKPLTTQTSSPRFSPCFATKSFGKSKWGLSKWGLKALVHNCPRLPMIVVILRRKFPLERGLKRPQKCTIVDDCARIVESGLNRLSRNP